ncbi:TRAP transporter small permease subunit [uncultured Cohaesibacter sp.]|uniref:TRAP transporter small permease n=1 Tax=uncultured Cohaesibacter sp. TaxID=1002546 RepID=UPI0029C65C73|nr:TRAP transporter small permease subunit [uncultured Cohaesibacter sp.]
MPRPSSSLANLLANLLAIVGLCALLALTALTLFDIGLRSDVVFSIRSFSTAFDDFLMESGADGLSDLYAPIGIIAVAFCFPAMTATRGAIVVDFVANAAPWRVREAMGVLGDICLCAMLGLMAWWVADYTVDVWDSGETTWLLEIPRWPAWAAASLSLFMSVLLQISMLFKQLRRVMASEEPEPEDGGEGFASGVE